MITINMADFQTGCEALVKYLAPYGHTPATITYKDGRKEKARLAWSSDKTPMRMSKGKRRWGQEISLFLNIESISLSEKKDNDEKEKWTKTWTKVIKRLKASGLNKNYLNDVETGFDIGYDKIKKANHLYSKMSYSDDRVEPIEAIDSRLIGFREDGEKYVDTGILWTTHRPAKIKKMYFGKYKTERILKELAQSIEEKKAYTNYTTAGYDVSVEYKPETSRLWYAEEYRNCGNGHYYLGLDATHVVFCEDD